MRLYEFENVSEDLMDELSLKKVLKVLQSGNYATSPDAIRIKNTIQQLWSAGEKALHRYKIELDQLNIPIHDVIK